MGKIRKNKNVVKLRLLLPANEGSCSSPRWVPISNREFSSDEKQGIRNILGNVYFHDELEEIYFEGKLQESNIPTQNDKNNTDIDNDIFKDNYFPDDGYDYEQHLRTINKSASYINPKPNQNNKVNQDYVSLILNSTSTLSNSEIDVNKDNCVTELVELTNCMEDPDKFEELNDDFIFDMTGLKDKYELDKNININSILWGEGNTLPSYKSEIQELDNELELSESITKSPDDSSIFSDDNHYDENCEDLFESVLNEYNDDSDTSENNTNEPCSDKSNVKLNISEYEHILDKYINQAKSRSSNERKSQKGFDEINIPFDQVQVEKIISILENTDIYDNSSEHTKSELSENESVEQEFTECFQNYSEVVNIPNKVNIMDYYSSKDLKNSIDSRAHIQKFDIKEINRDNSYNYYPQTSIVKLLPARRKNETPEDRRNRKQAVKQAKREMRDLKRRNKHDTKNLKKSIAGSFINTNQSDIKNGVRYFKF